MSTPPACQQAATTQRLSTSTLGLAKAARVPASRPRRLGIVHLGLGAFHRAHQAVFTEDAALATDDDRWGICGVTQRSSRVLEQLRPQDCLYTVVSRGPTSEDLRVVGQLSDVLFAAHEADRLQQLFADPDITLVTLTVTEKGYRRSPGGGLDLTDPLVVADLSGGRGTVAGQLVRGLQARAQADAGPITVLSCDNVTANGRVLAQIVEDFCAALPPKQGDAIGEWIHRNVAFPSSMVDRIVPASTDADRALTARRLGLTDEASVVAEPFRQWVIEDTFAAARPAWELAGAELVDDVEPYEQLKLRTLNAAHSMLAYLGALRGHETIAQAVADTELAGAVRHFIGSDVAPALAGGPFDVDAYGEEALRRFANPALGHRTLQVAMDGSQKLPLRLLPTVRDRLAAGATPRGATLAVAAWMAFVARGRDDVGRRLPLDDPMALRLREAADHADPAAVVDGVLGIEEIFGPDLRDSAVFRDTLISDLKELL